MQKLSSNGKLLDNPQNKQSMLKFFRKIRQHLLSENHFSKYLLYAVGEILLVVIGILLALQINNWNESRKLKQEEIQMLSEIKLALESDLANVFPERIQRNQKDIVRVNILLDFIEAPQTYTDSLRAHFNVLSRGNDFTPQTSAYKVLEAKGIDLISNTKLKNEILAIYNFDYPRITVRTENKFNNIREYGRPITRRELKRKRGPFALYEPININQLSSNPIFWNTLTVLNSNSKELLNLHEAQIIKVENLIQLIEEEIRSL